MKHKKSDEKVTILKDVFPYWAVIIGTLGCICFLFDQTIAMFSIFLGGIFSLIALKQLSEDQYQILVKGQRKRIFLSFVFRLFIYAFPIIIALKHPNYSKFWVILLFLFSSQIIFIVRELIINYNQYKQRINKNG